MIGIKPKVRNAINSDILLYQTNYFVKLNEKDREPTLKLIRLHFLGTI